MKTTATKSAMPSLVLRRSLLGVGALAALMFTGCGGSAPTPDGPSPLVVGMELDYPPFEMRSADGEPDGISVRLAEELAKYLDRPVRIEPMAWDGLIPSLQTKKIDLIISSMTRTEEREKSIAFSDGYVTNGLCMLVGKDSTIQSSDDLSESTAKVAVKLGTTGHTWAQQHLEGVELVVLDDAAACVLEVVQGKAAAFIYDQISIYQHWKRHTDTTRPILKPIRAETWAIGLRHGESELLGRINAFLAESRAKGLFDNLAGRYMADEKKAFEDLGVPFIFH